MKFCSGNLPLKGVKYFMFENKWVLESVNTVRLFTVGVGLNTENYWHTFITSDVNADLLSLLLLWNTESCYTVFIKVSQLQE